MKRQINAYHALSAVEAVSRGDYRYLDHHRDCRYTEIGPGGERVPSCIVGRAVSHLIPGFVMTDIAGCFHLVAGIVGVDTDVEFTTGAILVFQAAQAAQDHASTDEQACSIASRVRSALRYMDIE